MNQHNKRILVFLILSTALICSCRQFVNLIAKNKGLQGYYDNDYNWVSTPDYIMPDEIQWTKFISDTAIDHNLLSVAKAQLGDKMSPNQSYKMLLNADSSKTIILLLCKLKEKPTNLQVEINYLSQSDDPSWFGYTVTGVKLEGQWIFIVSDAMQFKRPDIEDAKFFHVANQIGKENKNVESYFKFIEAKNEERFWSTNDFAIIQSGDVLDKYLGYPEVYGWYKASQVGIERRYILGICSPTLDSVKAQFPIRYATLECPGRNYIDIITNWERTSTIFPIHYKSDTASKIPLILVHDKELGTFIWDFPADTAYFLHHKFFKLSNYLSRVCQCEIGDSQVFKENFWADYVFKVNEKNEFEYLIPIKKNYR